MSGRGVTLARRAAAASRQRDSAAAAEKVVFLDGAVA